MKCIKSRQLISVALLIFLASNAYCVQGNWYVDPNGSDGNNNLCTQMASPCKTLFRAASQSQGPGTIHLASGTFFESMPIWLPLQVSIKGAGMSETTIKTAPGFPAAGNPLIGISNAPMSQGNQTLSDFTVDGADAVGTRFVDYGIFVQDVSNVAVSKVGVINCRQQGIVFTHAVTPATVADYTSDQTVVDSYLANDAASAEHQGWAYGNIYAVGVRNLTIARNTIDTSKNYGFGIKGERIANAQVFSNAITTAATNPIISVLNQPETSDIGIEIIDIDGGDIYNNSSTASISVPRAKNVNVHHNILKAVAPGAGQFSVEINGTKNNVYANYIENMNGMLVSGATDTLRIYNNVLSNMTSGGILISADTRNPNGVNPVLQPIANVDIFNNTFDTVPPLYNSGAIGARIQDALGTIDKLNIKNNIVTHALSPASPLTVTGANGGTEYITDGNMTRVIVDSNMQFFNDLPAPYNAIRTYGNHVPVTAQNNLFLDPQYATDFNPATMSPFGRFALASGSPALGSGVNVGLPFLGSQSNRGAFIQPAGAVIEAEMNYSVQKQNGQNVASLYEFQTASNGRGISFLNAGDVIRVHFYIAAEGAYTLQTRMRSGDTFSDTGYFSNAYTFTVDGLQQLMTPIAGSVSSPIDPAGGGVYWGTWQSNGAVTLKKGMHSIEVTAVAPWAFIDYINVY